MVKIIFSTAIVLLISGCASGYSTHYTPATGATPEAISANRAALPPETPHLEHSAQTNGDAIASEYAKQGYSIIGYSFFNTGQRESEKDALQQGKKVGADLVVILNPKYTGSITSNVPITTPTTSTSYTSGSATAYGSSGAVNAYGSSTTTTYGSATTYVPVTTHRSDYGAIFFVKIRVKFGMVVRDLNDDEIKKFKTNHGIIVSTIIKDSPAFVADILPGDRIKTIDNTNILTSENAAEVLKNSKSESIEIVIERDGMQIKKLVSLHSTNRKEK